MHPDVRVREHPSFGTRTFGIVHREGAELVPATAALVRELAAWMLSRDGCRIGPTCSWSGCRARPPTTRNEDRDAHPLRHRVHLPGRRRRGARRRGGLPAHRLDLRHRGRTRRCTSTRPRRPSAPRPCCSGGRTYEGFAEAWPPRDGDFADKFNRMEKVVVSTTLSDPTWNNTTVVRDLDAVRALKEGDGGPIGVARQPDARAVAAQGRPGRRVAPDGLPGHPRQRQAAVPDRRRGQGQAHAARVPDLHERRPAERLRHRAR